MGPTRSCFFAFLFLIALSRFLVLRMGASCTTTTQVSSHFSLRGTRRGVTGGPVLFYMRLACTGHIRAMACRVGLSNTTVPSVYG